MNTIGDAADFVSGGTPKKSIQEYWQGNIPWFSAANMSRRFLDQSEMMISEAGLQAGSRLAPTGATLLLVRGSGLFNHVPICYADRAVAFNQDVKALVPKKGVDPLYLHYSLEAHRRKLNENIGVTGIGAGKFDTDFVKSLSFVPRTFEEQRHIGKIASAYDRKIDINRQMNETLEEMARALFRDWFIDFGPTRRQMDGATDPAAIMGHAFPNNKAAALAPLFPARFAEDGLPEGWIKGILESIANSPRRGIHPTDVAENTPYIGLEHMPRRSIALGQWEGAGKVTSNKSVFKKGDLLFGKLRPYFHKVGRAPVDGICSTDIVVISPKSKEWDAFVTSCLSSDSFVEYTNKTATGTRMPRTSWKIMAQYAICLPPEPIAKAFQDTVEPLLEMIHSNIYETHILAQMRDLLLPKLMSGEIQLKDAPMVQDIIC